MFVPFVRGVQAPSDTLVGVFFFFFFLAHIPSANWLYLSAELLLSASAKHVDLVLANGGTFSSSEQRHFFKDGDLVLLAAGRSPSESWLVDLEGEFQSL